MSATQPQRRTSGATTSRGLYGSRIGERRLRAALTELVGTAVLIFTGTAVVCASLLTSSTRGFDLLAVALAFGLALGALVAALGHLSGAHFNPAVTVAIAAAGQFPWKHVPSYVVAQLCGAVAGGLTVWATFGSAARSRAHLGLPAPSRGVGAGRVLFVEAAITFVLVLVVTAVGTDERVPAAVAPLAAGFALTAAVFIGATITGGGANPARSLAPMLVTGRFTDWWAYILGPLFGGATAAVGYHRLLADAVPPA